jgi:hypothetical protein
MSETDEVPHEKGAEVINDTSFPYAVPTLFVA